MSEINYQALREAAEKATPGNWWIDSHGQAMVSFIDNEVLEVFVTDNKRDAVRHEDTGNLSRWRNDNDATFIATANPATVLVLLDELDKWQQESSAWQAVAEKQLALAEDADKRIAELEARVVVPDEMTPKQASRSYCGEVRGYRDGWNACRAKVIGSMFLADMDRVATDNTNQQFESLSRGDK